MEEQELPPIQITTDDIAEANQLSLHCPICSGPVERFVEERPLVAIVCEGCSTLYHKACWEQSGGTCAVLGCDSKTYRLYAQPAPPAITISRRDVAQHGANGRSRQSSRNKELKHEQRREVERMRRGGFWQRLWQWLLDQIRIET